MACQERDLDDDGDFADSDEMVYYHSTTIHSVYALTNSSESVIERYRYDAYGKATVLEPDWSADSDNASDVHNPYQYTGRRNDAETNLYQYRHRYYSWRLGRFISRDPKGYVDGWNLYEYGGGKPLIATDPMGFWNRNLHYDLTVDWAGQARGYDHEMECWTTFPHRALAVIAEADIQIDHGDTRSSKYPWLGDYTWHFDCRDWNCHEQGPFREQHTEEEYNEAVDFAQNSNCYTAWRHLGRALHPLQDSYSHTERHNASTPLAHANAGHHPDKVTEWPMDVRRTEDATTNLLMNFLNIDCNPCTECAPAR